MNRRIIAVAGALAILVAGQAFGSPPAGADVSITPASTTVAAGATFSVTPNGCPTFDEDTPDGFRYQRAELIVVSGAGGAEVLASYGNYVTETRVRFRVPGWVDPAQPAVVTGRCLLTEYTFSSGIDAVTTTTVATFPDVAIDITPAAPGAVAPAFTLNRTTAAGGQVIRATGSGCVGRDYAQVALQEGADLSGRTSGDLVAFGGAEVAADGSFAVDLPLVLRASYGEDASLPEGPYAVRVLCGSSEDEDGSSFALARSVVVTVDGTNPVESFVLEVDDGQVQVQVMGSGCLGGQIVTVELRGWSYEEVLFDRAIATGPKASLADLLPGPDGELTETLTIVPEPDGTWSGSTGGPEDSFDLTATAACGDPLTTGFQYATRYAFSSNFADVYVDRVSPTSSPVGGPVDVHIQGYCEDAEVTAQVLDAQGTLLDESAAIELHEYGMGSASVQAPSTPGTYRLAGACDGDTGYGEAFEVFAPNPVAADAPLAAETTVGWPTKGARQTYEGRIGPIDLPAMQMTGMDAAARKLGPSELFIDVPRPDGDFAITKMTYDLVDADGEPVGHDDAHLHHFVVSNTTKDNPACPSSTFGLPGEIVLASGAERTLFQSDDPYGIVVRDEDSWGGVYDIMSRSMQDQEVYLTYDLEYRTDVDNVRPLTRYFGSATGCSSFTWTIDGSGVPDVQSTYVTIAESGRLVGAGAHLHSGGAYGDFVNDKGRRLCRSELQEGEVSMGHGHGETDDDWPPEFYDDDPMLLGITNCSLAESVTAGERIRFDAAYTNERPRSGVMGIFTMYVWEGGGPAQPGMPGAQPQRGNPNYTG